MRFATWIQALALGISTQVTAFETPQACVDLQPGQSRDIDLPYQHSPTGLPMSYKVSRLDDKNYQIAVPVDIHGPEDLVVAMKSRVKNCLARSSYALLGPHGEKINLKIVEPAEASELTPHRIDISTLSRDTSTQFSFSPFTTDCPAITHEVMHMLGLVDEYPEPSLSVYRDSNNQMNYSWQNVGARAYDCRALGPKDSVMYQQDNAYKKANLPLLTIDCVCKTRACKEALRALKNQPADVLMNVRSCPAGSDENIHQNISDFDLGDAAGATFPAVDQMTIVLGNPKHPTASLLYPGEFNAIIHPGCAQNRLFYTCASNAYVTSIEHNGMGCYPETPSDKTACEAGTWLTEDLFTGPHSSTPANN
jgi:hypothetical protein